MFIYAFLDSIMMVANQKSFMKGVILFGGGPYRWCLAGSVIGLLISIPLFLLFSPVIVPAALTIGLAATGFLASGMFGLTGLSSVSWVLNYLRGTRKSSVPEQLEYAKKRMADAVGYAGQKGKEMGQHVQNKAQEAKQYDISKTHDTTTKGHETTQRTAAA